MASTYGFAASGRLDTTVPATGSTVAIVCGRIESVLVTATYRRFAAAFQARSLPDRFSVVSCRSAPKAGSTEKARMLVIPSPLLSTSRGADAGVATAAAGMTAWISVSLTMVVARVLLFHLTMVAGVKFSPVSVMVTSGLPATTDSGLRLLSWGVGVA